MNIVHTNIEVYRAIAEDAFEEMIQLDSSSRRPKDDGANGFIITYDPEHKSFKKSMIVVVFTGMWLEALLHQEIVKKYGEAEFKKVDRKKTYEQKLALLGIHDQELMDKVKRFRETRKELVHEKAFLDEGQIKTAQKEANVANEVMSGITEQLQ